MGGFTKPTNKSTAPAWLLEPLSDGQRRFWGLLESKKVNDKPRHFNAMDVVEWCKEAGEFQLDYREDDVHRQIALFLRLGLILEVYSQGRNLYRIATEGDIAGFAGDSE